MLAYKSNIENGGGAALLIVDAQNDFHPGGTLAIPSADEDAARIADLIRKNKFEEIYCTLDSHEQMHIAHPLFWTNKQGEHPAPFTSISSSEVEEGIWKPTRKDRGLLEWCKKYVGELEKRGRFTLTIWPYHCLVGTKGHCIRDSIGAALQEWERTNKKAVHYIIKGNNSYTEHYSAIKAEVEREDDPNTKLNANLMSNLKHHSRIYICGQALSHCVNFTTRDIAENWDQKRLDQLVILSDCASSVPGFEEAGEKFLQDMSEKGLVIAKSATVVI